MKELKWKPGCSGQNSNGSQRPKRRPVCGFFRTMHEGVSAPSCCGFFHRVVDRCVHLWGWTEGLSYIPLCLDTKSNHSVQFSCSVMSESLQPHGLQHARPPCPSPTPRVYSNSCPLSWWCHPTVSSFVIPFSSCLQSFPASESLQMSQFFASGGQSVGVSASISVLPMNIQDWFPLGWTGWISLKSKGLSIVFSNTTVQKHQFFGAQLSLWFTSHIHTWPLEKPYPWLDRPLLAK